MENMTFKDIKNNDLLIKRISKSIIKGNISHAYIFDGASRKDRISAADGFAKAILCRDDPGTGCGACIICKKIEHGNHEDLIYVEKYENSIKDESIEELQRKLKNKPIAGDRNIAIIKDADMMTSRAHNRLLKTLEEPFKGTVIILLADNIENLTQTILSRCVVLRWQAFLGEGDRDLAETTEELLRALFDGEPFYLTKQRIIGITEDRDEAYKLLDSMESAFGRYIRENSYSRVTIKNVVGCIEEARQELKRGMQTGQSLKRMMLKIGG